MTIAEIVTELRRLADKIEQGGKQNAPSIERSAPTPPSADGWQRALCTFWAVEEKTNDRGPYTAARIGLRWKDANGEQQSCFLSTFDRQLISKVDPVPKGVAVEYRVTRDKSGREKLADLVVKS